MKLTDVYIVMENRIVFGDLVIDNDTIISIVEKDNTTQRPAKFVVPGFIDLHTHGAGSYDAMDANPQAIEEFALSLVREGTTGFLATTMTQTIQNITTALSNISSYMNNQNRNSSIVLGIHLEGPFIHEKAAGAQPINCITKANTNTFNIFEIASNNQIKKVSLTPDNPASLDLITYLNQKGIIASIAHTKATYNDVHLAIKAGAKSVTHMYNAMTPLHHRDIGVVGAALLHDELSAELILDKVHVSIPAVKLLLKNKGLSGVIVITDSMRAKYMPEGEYDLGGQVTIVKQGEARLSDGTLAGSILKMNEAYKYLIQDFNLSLSEASVLCSLNAAKQLGIEKSVGSIAPFKKANLVVLNESFEVLQTIINGHLVYEVE